MDTKGTRLGTKGKVGYLGYPYRGPSIRCIPRVQAYIPVYRCKEWVTVCATGGASITTYGYGCGVLSYGVCTIVPIIAISGYMLWYRVYHI